MRIEAPCQSGQQKAYLQADFSIEKGTVHLNSKLIDLLFLIQETKSVRDACGHMKISYSTAWNMLNAAEDHLGYPLVVRNKGGASGSGSVPTEKGLALMQAYSKFEAAAKQALGTLFDTYLLEVL